MDWFKTLFLLIALWGMAYMVTFHAPKQDKEYLENGIQVQATISSVKRGIRGTKSYSCTYVNENGEQVSAELILNQENGGRGQIVTGYYLPEKPGTVWCKPDDTFMLIFTIFIDALAIGFTILCAPALVPNSHKESDGIPSYARESASDTVPSVSTTAHNDPWGNFQKDTWDQQYHAQSDAVTGFDSPDSENDSNKSSTGLKLKL